MAYNPNIHHRRSIRLKGYDYSKAGLYFITICVQNRICMFGEIVGAPLVGAQNDGIQNMDTQYDVVQNMGAQNNGIQNNDVNQNETGFGNDNGRTNDDGSQIGRPQGHAPNADATMILNDAGIMVETEWLKLTERFPNIKLHEYVVMPNHFHAILQIVDVGALVDAQNETNDIDKMAKGHPQWHAPTTDIPTEATSRNKTVCDILDAFKSITTVEYIRGVKTFGWPRFYKKIWQRDYWEHIIRDERSYQNIANYIINNPSKWKNDKFYKG